MAKAPASVAVIGGGWAGCSAAVELARVGCTVTVFEAGRSLGGRARAVDIQGKRLDNGQHILLGAYSATLALMKRVGVERKEALLNLPLQMRYPAGSGGMDFVAPRLPAPLHLLVALVRAGGLAREDKLALARFSTSARWMDWKLYNDCSVSELLARFDQTERLTALMWRPLCLAALNTPPERASAQVFLNVLRDSLGARAASADMLLPRVDLGALLPEAAARFVASHGGTIHCGAKVTALAQDQGHWRIDATGSAIGGSSSVQVDAVVVACPPAAAAVLLCDVPGWQGGDTLAAFSYEPITTCYLQYGAATALPLPMAALLDDAASGHWGQFVFDRGQLDPANAGLLAVVVSASSEAGALDQHALAQAISAQLAAVFGRPDLAQPLWQQVVTEKRATFACAPGLQRPPNATGIPALVLAGDYTAGDYPATLEAAVRSGAQAARLLVA